MNAVAVACVIMRATTSPLRLSSQIDRRSAPLFAPHVTQGTQLAEPALRSPNKKIASTRPP